MRGIGAVLLGGTSPYQFARRCVAVAAAGLTADIITGFAVSYITRSPELRLAARIGVSTGVMASIALKETLTHFERYGKNMAYVRKGIEAGFLATVVAILPVEIMKISNVAQGVVGLTAVGVSLVIAAGERLADGRPL